MNYIYSPVWGGFYYKYPKKSCSILSNASGISSLASTLTNITAIVAVSSLVTGMIAYKISPLLSPRVQLEQLNRNIDDILALLERSSGHMDADHRDKVSTHLQQIQIDACVAELRLLNAQKDDVSWREYFRSSKGVYIDARACCKEVNALRLSILIANMAAKQKRFSLEQAKDIQRTIESNPESSEIPSPIAEV